MPHTIPLSIKQLLTGICLLPLAVCTGQSYPCDAKATKETVALYNNLKKLAKKGYMFGHQDDLAYGVYWKYQAGRSDVKDASGDYPAVYGWDLGGTERADNSLNIDGVPFKKMRQYIQDGYRRGGVITLSWHFDNPFTGGNAWDTTHGTVTAVLPGGEKHELFKEWLNKAAVFIASLKSDNKTPIPILFRPYHELTGNWFWWCRNNCTPEQFKILWRFTVYYLKEVRNLHNIIYVYNTSGDFKTGEEFLEYYPGDDMADILSFDAYQYDNPETSNAFVLNTNRMLRITDSIAREKDKLLALAETGYEQVPYAFWWTETLARAIGDVPISYVLVWRNHGYNEWMKKMHYYVPYPGDVSEPDFKKFHALERTLFEQDAAREKLYQQ